MENTRPKFDQEILKISEYAVNYQIHSDLAYQTAYYVWLDSLACSILALKNPHCVSLLGPIVPGATLATGSKIPGTDYQLEPVQAAFNLGAMIRWLDFNDTWLAAEWGHPSDNLGGLWTLMDYLNRAEGDHYKTYTLHDLLTAAIKAHEIQGVIALKNSFNRAGLDHVVLVKVATTAIASALLSNDVNTVANAVSNAWLDGQSLRTYRHAPNTGSRKSWAAGDASSRGVRLALMARRGEMGYPSALSAPKWGFYDVSFKSQPLQINQDFGSYVMENVLFKIAFPAEFHAQTAVECAFALHPIIKNKFDEIASIELETQEAGMRIINKTGPLYNEADRDHCLQYMVAIGLLFGELTPEHYEDHIAKNPMIDRLRGLMQVKENPEFTQNYFDLNKRSIGNSVQIKFKDGSQTEKISIEYPIGHPQRRQEGIPLLLQKFKAAISNHYNKVQAEEIIQFCSQPLDVITKTSVNQINDLLFLTRK